MATVEENAAWLVQARERAAQETATRSGSNFSDTVTGQQDIYDSGDYGYLDSDAVNQTQQPTYGGGYDSGDYGYFDSDAINKGSNSSYADSGGGSGGNPNSDWNIQMAKMLAERGAREDARKQGYSISTPAARQSGSSGASSARVIGGTGGGMTMAQANTAADLAAANAEWERRFNLQTAANNAPRTTTTSAILPSGSMPTIGEMPSFNAPTRDEGRVKELTQQKSAAGLRAMRSQIQKAMGQGYRNENVKRMTLRDALSGYGQGVENVMSGAQTQAESAYNTEYATQYDTAGKNWQSAVSAKMADWQNKVNNYFKQYGQSSTTVTG